jgi:hypothetical protein
MSMPGSILTLETVLKTIVSLQDTLPRTHSIVKDDGVMVGGILIMKYR